MDLSIAGATLSARLSKAWMVPESVARKMFWMERKKFLRRFRVLVMAKLPHSDALDELRASALENKRGVMFAALDSMVQRQRRGRDLSDTFDGWFAPADIMLMEAGERRGGGPHLAAAIDEVLDMQGATKEMVAHVLAGLFEPAVMLAAIYALVTWLAGTFTGEVLTLMKLNPDSLTGSARQLYVVGVFSQSAWVWIVPLFILATLVAIFLSLPGVEIKRRGVTRRLFTSRQRGSLDRLIPPWSVYAQMTSARWLLAFAKLSAAGYTHELIMERTAALASPWMRERIQAIEVAYRKGLSLGRAMKRTGYRFPADEVIEDIAVFAERPDFDAALNTIAKEWVREVTARVKALAFVLTAAGFIATTAAMIWVMDSFNALQTQVTATANRAGPR